MRPSEESPRRAAFERAVQEFADRTYRIALRITGSPSEAEDVMQDTFVAAYERWASFRGEAALSTWLYRIAVNAALMRVRRRRPTAYLDDTGEEALGVEDWSADPARQVERSELQDVLAQGIARLPDDFRPVLVLRDVEGLSTAEVAEILGLSEAALKSRLHRARLLLRQHLTDYLRPRGER